MDKNENIQISINKKIEELMERLDRLRLIELIELLEDPKKIIMRNFLAGLSRGLGMAIGFTLLGALAIYFLQKLVILNLPIIGDFIADIIIIVQQHLN